MTVDALDASRADHIYRIGPETLLAQSFAVATGPVSRYARQTLEMSQPGPDGFPVRWTVSGRVEQPQVIKGQPPGGDILPFVRHEQAGPLPPPQPVAAWEQALGDLAPGDEVLLFFLGSPAKPVLRVLPSRQPASGLAALVRRAAAIQALPDPAQREAAWLGQLQAAADDDGRQAALRSLLALGTDWARLQGPLSAAVAGPAATVPFQRYAAGLVAWGLMQGHWSGHPAAATDFVCRQFDAARDRWLSMQLALTLRQLMDFGAAEPGSPPSAALRQRVAASVRRALAAGGLAPEVEQQLRLLKDRHPTDF